MCTHQYCHTFSLCLVLLNNSLEGSQSCPGTMPFSTYSIVFRAPKVERGREGKKRKIKERKGRNKGRRKKGRKKEGREWGKEKRRFKWTTFALVLSEKTGSCCLWCRNWQEYPSLLLSISWPQNSYRNCAIAPLLQPSTARTCKGIRQRLHLGLCTLLSAGASFPWLPALRHTPNIPLRLSPASKAALKNGPPWGDNS